MKFNFQLRDLFLLLLGGILIWQFFQRDIPSKEEIKPVTVIIPEKSGTTGTQVIERITSVPVYIPKYNETITVDEKYKKLYEETKDSVDRMNLYLKAIKINEYDKTLVDNDTIQIIGKAKTRGDLLDYKVDWKIKQTSFTYTPEVIYKKPSLMMGMAFESGIPLNPDTGFLMKGNLNFINGKGNGLSVGYDTDKRVWLGISKTFTIKK